jgi:hypothetical protein
LGAPPPRNVLAPAAMAPAFLRLEKKSPGWTIPPYRLVGGTLALELRAHLHPAGDALATSVNEVMYSSLGARVEDLGAPPPRTARAPAATAQAFPNRKTPWPRWLKKRRADSGGGLAHFVAAVLQNIPICALKLGDRTSLAGVARGLSKDLRCAEFHCCGSESKVWGVVF